MQKLVRFYIYLYALQSEWRPVKTVKEVHSHSLNKPLQKASALVLRLMAAVFLSPILQADVR